MILTYERAADGEIAAGKGSAQWTPEGKPNADSVLVSRGDGEDTSLSKSAYDSMRRVGVIYITSSRVAPQEIYHSCPSMNLTGTGVFYFILHGRHPAVSTTCLLSAIIERRKKK